MDRRDLMKKKLFVWLALLCLVALIVPVTALAAQTETTATIETAGETAYYYYTPEVTCTCTYYSASEYDTVGYLYDGDGNLLCENDDTNYGANFQITYLLEAGTTYKFGARFYSSELTGSIPLVIETVPFEPDTITADTELSVEITEDASVVYLAFTPAYSTNYTLYSSVDSDTRAYLYDSNMALLGSDDDGGSGNNFSLTYSLTAGETYYYAVRFYYTGETGTIPVYLQQHHVYSATTITPNSCYTDGVSVFTCDVCGYSYEGVVPAAHSWDENDVCSVCGTGWYAEGTCGDALTWYLDADGVLTISGEGEMDYFDWGGAPWYQYLEKITSIVIEDGITSVGGCAFYNCYNVTSVTMGDSVTYIDEYAFFCCSSLTSIRLSESLLDINYGAFQYCFALEEITLPDSLGYIGSYAFCYCESLKTITVPKNVYLISNSAFFNCWAMNGYWVAADNPYYTNDAYGVLYSKDMTALCRAPISLSGSYTIPNSVTTIEYNAFCQCANLTSVTIPDSVTYIGYYAFLGAGLTNVTVPDSVTDMGGGVFRGCEDLTSAKLSSGMNYIPSGTFCECYKLTSVTIPDNVLSIHDTAFDACIALTSIDLPESLNDIQEYAFYNCESLTSIELPSSLTYINYCAFTWCEGLTNIVIPANVEYIGDSAFSRCDNVTKIAFLGDAPEFSIYSVFYNVTATAYYPAGNSTWTEDVMQDYGGTLTWTSYTPAAISSQPATQKVKAGNTATFKVTASGTDLSYQWQTKTSSSGKWVNCSFTGSQTATLKVPATTARNGYYYRCKITDVSGNVVYTKTVRLYALGVKTQPTTQKVKAGATATFTVSATGSGKTYQWQTKTSSSGSWKNCTFTGSKTATMSVPATTGRNGYYYRCKITDSAGNVVYTNTVRLYVLGIKTQPSTQKVKAGTTAKFTVSATGYGLRYQWQTKTSSSGSWKNCTFTGSKTATMSVSATTARNGYYYRCKITDSAGNVTYTNTVRLYVLGIKTQPTSKTVKSGNTAKFTVSATGSGLTYQWQYKTSSGWKNTTLTGAKTATLSVKGTSARNGMKYRCKITDSAGNVIYTNTVTLTVK